jgi:DNA topoisomerase-1
VSQGRVRLRYVADTQPGFRRTGRGRRTRYVDQDGRPIRDAAVLARIRALAIPPAWTDVWICADAEGHLQAVGRDARGRKQYRYHPEWRRRRDIDKHARVLRLGRRLPRIRAAVDADLARPGLPREKVLALAVRLLDVTHLRVGGESYARDNRSHGLTTLRDRQVRVEGSQVRLRFRGKGGAWHDIGVRDRRLAGLVRRVQELPGQRLFEYLDEQGEAHPVRSEDVNEYLRTIAGFGVTAKDLRTWGATVLALRALRGLPVSARTGLSRRQLRAAMEQTARHLGNTPAVTRASYVDARLVEAWQEGAVGRLRIADGHDPQAEGPPTPEEEAAALRILSRQARAATRRARSVGRSAATSSSAATSKGTSARAAPARPPARAQASSGRMRSA